MNIDVMQKRKINKKKRHGHFKGDPLSDKKKINIIVTQKVVPVSLAVFKH